MHRGLVRLGIGISGLDPVHVALDALSDQVGQDLGVADLENPSAAVVVVLPGSGKYTSRTFTPAVAVVGLVVAWACGDSSLEQAEAVRAAPARPACSSSRRGREEVMPTLLRW
ncbi:hypothetical protein GCM10027456_32940 [Kineosporia babensis]